MSDEAVLKKSLEDPEAFGVLVERYQEAFLRKARSILHGEEDAEDAVQTAFTKIYLNAHKFRKQEGAGWSSWAYKILINTCLTEYRKMKRRSDQTVLLSDEMLEVLENRDARFLEKIELSDMVASVMTKMPGKLSRILKLQFMENMTQKEIAERENISVGAVKSRIYRAKREFEKLSNIHI